MLSSLLCILFVTALTAPAAAQETQPAPESGQARDLAQAHTIITDTNASPEVRRIGAENLLELDSVAAVDMAVEILCGQGDPLPRIAMCEALVAVGSRQPGLLDQRLVPPLLELLRSADAGLRSVAAGALASFPDGQVAQQLGELAANVGVPPVQRLAAVDALAPNVDRRQVVQQLIRLLDTDSPQIRSRVLAVLRPATGVDYGEDLERWKQWWQAKATLDETQWLQDRVRLLRQQNRRSQEAMARLLADSRQSLDTLARRLREQLELTYRLTPQPQKEELLVHWLRDQLVECRAAAVSQIAANISDGNRPSPAVRAALRERFTDTSSDLRRQVFDLVAALTDPADVEPVRLRLEQETEPVVREAILRTLGRLQHPTAIEPLAAELANPDATEGCLVEAAISLGLLGARDKVDPAAIAVAVGPLKERFASAGGDALRLRAALLGAMASIAAGEFAQEFLANLDADQADLILQALEGVRMLGDVSRIDRVLALTGSDDARVRRRAIEALATLGRDPAHLEALVSRLNPATEPNEAVRQAAWGGFCEILAAQPPALRLQWAGRLADLPEREEAYLIELVADLADGQPPTAELTAARRRLAEMFDTQGRYAESYPYWRDLWQASARDGAAHEVGPAYLRAALRAVRYEKLDELVAGLIERRGDAAAEIRTLLVAHLQSLQTDEHRPQLEPYLDALDRLPSEVFGPDLGQAIDQARAELTTPADPGTPEPLED